MQPFRSMGSIFRTLGILLLAARSAEAQPACHGLQFGDPLPLATFQYPHASVIADFNEDGKNDLAIALSMLTSGPPGRVSVFLGDGTGQFASPVLYPTTGANTMQIVSADFNNDGILDLATTNLDSKNVSCLLGQGSGGVGNGTFAAALNSDVGRWPWDLAAGDFDEDGILDLAVSINVAPGGVTIMKGFAGGTFGFSSFNPLPNVATDVNVADVNEDGILDVLVAVPGSHQISVLLGNGTAGVGNGFFGAPTQFFSGVTPFMFDIADLDSDGILDLAVANGSDGGLQFMRGLGAGGVGNGTFAAPFLIAHGNVGAVASADINQDGILDLVSTRTDASQTMLVSIGHGDGTFDGPHFYPLGFAVGIAVGNFDASPKLDVAVCNYYDNQVKVLLGTCSDPVSVEPPRYRFALDPVTPQPARSGWFEVRFHLADRSPASLEILDVAGRRVMRERVDSFGPGDHVFPVGGRTRIPTGVYLVRLTSGTLASATRAVVIQ